MGCGKLLLHASKSEHKSLKHKCEYVNHSSFINNSEVCCLWAECAKLLFYLVCYYFIDLFGPMLFLDLYNFYLFEECPACLCILYVPSSIRAGVSRYGPHASPKRINQKQRKDAEPYNSFFTISTDVNFCGFLRDRVFKAKKESLNKYFSRLLYI